MVCLFVKMTDIKVTEKKQAREKKEKFTLKSVHKSAFI